MERPFKPLFGGQNAPDSSAIRETAKALGLTVQATKTRLFRARSRLRRHLHTAFAGVTVTPNIVFRS